MSDLKLIGLDYMLYHFFFQHVFFLPDCPRSAEVKEKGNDLKEVQPPVQSSHAVPMETPKRPPSSPASDTQEEMESGDKG